MAERWKVERIPLAEVAFYWEIWYGQSRDECCQADFRMCGGCSSHHRRLHEVSRSQRTGLLNMKIIKIMTETAEVRVRHQLLERRIVMNGSPIATRFQVKLRCVSRLESTIRITYNASIHRALINESKSLLHLGIYFFFCFHFCFTYTPSRFADHEPRTT